MVGGGRGRQGDSVAVSPLSKAANIGQFHPFSLDGGTVET